jgi:sugar transferase (PEP-CTERM/EpsH1 system associated)
MTSPAAGRIHVMHIVYRFDTGGLENGLVNLVNGLPAGRFRHTIVAITDVAPAFRQRLHRDDVECIALHKPPGHAFRIFAALLKLLREKRPDIVHTRNLAALECQPVAWWAGVPGRIHGEHGWDVDDLGGRSRKHRWVRRLYQPFVKCWVALSRELADYLRLRVGVAAAKVREICNGVDTGRFAPAAAGRAALAGSPFNQAGLVVVGTVGRMQAVKHQTVLVRAFIAALERDPGLRSRLRLVLVGDGPLRAECQALLREAGVADLAWLPGERADVPEVMRALDCFVLPSLAEGISNTILEAMASGLPVLATRVGGNADLVAEGETGLIVEAADVQAMAQALASLAADPERMRAMGAAGRRRAEQNFSLTAMVAAYQALYEQVSRPNRLRG